MDLQPTVAWQQENKVGLYSFNGLYNQPNTHASSRKPPIPLLVYENEMMCQFLSLCWGHLTIRLITCFLLHVNDWR